MVEANAKKRKRRNFTKSVKVDKKNLRKGRDKTDALYYHKKTLIANCKKLHRITGAAVTILIKPLTNRGKVINYTSPGVDSFVPKAIINRVEHSSNKDNNQDDDREYLAEVLGEDQVEEDEDESDQDKNEEDESLDFVIIDNTKNKVITPKKKFGITGSRAAQGPGLSGLFSNKQGRGRQKKLMKLL